MTFSRGEGSEHWTARAETSWRVWSRVVGRGELRWAEGGREGEGGRGAEEMEEGEKGILDSREKARSHVC